MTTMKYAALWLVLLSCFLCFDSTVFCQEVSKTTIVYEQKNIEHSNFLESLRQAFSKVDWQLLTIESDNSRLEQTAKQSARWLALGEYPCRVLINRLKAQQILCLDLFYASALRLERLSRENQHRLFVIPRDATLPRLLSLITLSQPQLQSVGVLVSTQSSNLIAELPKFSNELALRHFILRAGDNPMRGFRFLAERNDAVFVAPDLVIRYREHLPSFFLSAFRLNRPVFSGQEIDYPGALFTVHLPLENTLSDLYQTLNSLTASPAPDFRVVKTNAKNFVLTFNEQAARSLGLSMTEKQLVELLHSPTKNNLQ